jgi:ribosomal protein S12 methylthiotransferase accessory factor
VRNPFALVPPIVLPPRAAKAPGISDRSVPFAKTFARIPELRERYGITRVGDTTYLDRTEIPTFCAVVPNSADLISVYNGKGRTAESATVSAVMEAVERQVAALADLPTFLMRASDVLEFVNLRAAGLREDVLDLETPCVAATELLSGTVVPLPLATVQCPWFGEKLFDTTSSNGLASGNTLTEAIYHALTELIERHVWSLFYVRSQLVPRFYLGPGSPDVAHAREVVLPTGDSTIDGLVEAITRTGMDVRLLVLEEPPLPTVVLAGVADSKVSQPMAHAGLGCSLSTRHAAERALTECIQSRVVDIQAAREDILRADEPGGVFGTHARRNMVLPKGRWYFDLPADRVALEELPERMTDDLAMDVRITLEALRTHEISGVYIVDFVPPTMSVVRAVAPELETTVLNGRIGPLARREFNPFYVRG